MSQNENHFTQLLKEITDIGIALSAEKDHARLLKLILLKAKELTNADGGTLYICQNNQYLHFEIMMNDSLGIYLDGSEGKKITYPPLPLYHENGEGNTNMIATSAVLKDKAINVIDAYDQSEFDFSGTIAFDKASNYRSQSFLTVPMSNHLNEVIGVLQLINARKKGCMEVIAFSALDQQVVEALASQAAVIMTNRSLIKAQRDLFDALIQLIANSIDEKSPYTAGHCRRVPVIARLLADAVCDTDKGPLKDFFLDEEQKYELDVAAWLHDCGKITTPVQIVDKATKLEKIVDRIDWVDTRFEVLRREAILEMIANTPEYKALASNPILQKKLQQLEEERQWLHECNKGKESITPEEINRIERISNQFWYDASGQKTPLLSEEESSNLKISRGTLSSKDRDIINHHVSVSIMLLEALPYPKGLKRVPLIAGAHHEKMDGSGYPKGLSGKEMPVEARILAIADIFEALTASDRPYKKGICLSKALKILGQMKLDGHIDPDLFDVFMHAKVYQSYAKDYLDEEAMDEIDFDTIPGYKPLS